MTIGHHQPNSPEKFGHGKKESNFLASSQIYVLLGAT